MNLFIPPKIQCDVEVEVSEQQSQSTDEASFSDLANGCLAAVLVLAFMCLMALVAIAFICLFFSVFVGSPTKG